MVWRISAQQVVDSWQRKNWHPAATQLYHWEYIEVFRKWRKAETTYVIHINISSEFYLPSRPPLPPPRNGWRY